MTLFGKDFHCSSQLKQMQKPTEFHPLEPFTPENAVVLMLGSFPPLRSKWKMDFYYPNFQNDMWRIFGLVFFDNREHFLTEDKTSFDKERIVDFLTLKKIAVGDTGFEVRRLKDNASDNFLEIVTPVNLKEVLSQIPNCRTFVTTGQKATETLHSLFTNKAPIPKVGSHVSVNYLNREYRFYRMPSSSRAYPRPLEEKAKVYAQLFKEIGLL